MKDKLEVGMYVRINDNKATVSIGIGRIINIVQDIIYVNMHNNSLISFTNVFETKDIAIASHNLTDLIEVGDYVNGYKIDYINLNCETPFLRSNQPYRVDNTLYSTLIEKGEHYNQPLHFYSEDIKTILTKEQYENNCYKVEE